MTRDPLQVIPGIGVAGAGDLRALGIEQVDQLPGRDPEDLYAGMKEIQGPTLDRCVLYVFRCAVYFAEGGRDSELLKWWNWKDSARPPLGDLQANR